MRAASCENLFRNSKSDMNSLLMMHSVSHEMFQVISLFVSGSREFTLDVILESSFAALLLCASLASCRLFGSKESFLTFLSN